MFLGGDCMITLHNVIDIRTGQLHSVAVVSDRNAKWYKAVEEPKKTKSKANNTNEETAH